MKKSLVLFSICFLGSIFSFETINVSAKTTSKKIRLSHTKLSLFQGEEKTLKLLNTKAKVSFSSSNKAIVSVNTKTGKVTAKNIGTAIITAKVTNGKQYRCKIVVKLKKAEIPKISSKLKNGHLITVKGMKITLPRGWEYEVYKKSKKSIQYICINLPDDNDKGCMYITWKPYTSKKAFYMTEYTKKMLYQLVTKLQKAGYQVKNSAYNTMKVGERTIGIMRFQTTKSGKTEYETILIQKKKENILWYEVIGTSKKEQKKFESSALYTLKSLK